ncbi:hypothetical protein [Azospirillum soli]|uniref:hypothetical protein n=1 Tax=Azospirillum soli TaxID=1304799 RepID=UPI001AE2A912|nr:hypothetical protein [Azospirillum soli]MBP2314305.1 acyl carrier protein [Azospirillum soli]
MTTVTFDALAELIRRSVTTLPAGHHLSEADQLTDLGIDSLTLLNIIMDAASVHGLDLARLSEDLTPPTTTAGLLDMLNQLVALPAPA